MKINHIINNCADVVRMEYKYINGSFFFFFLIILIKILEKKKM